MQQCHLMQVEGKIDTEFVLFPENNTIEQYRFLDGCVRINSKQVFHNINESDWDYTIGGYQPLQKWLKDRKGLSLTADDVLHFERIIFCIRLTKKIVAEIDEVAEL